MQRIVQGHTQAVGAQAALEVLAQDRLVLRRKRHSAAPALLLVGAAPELAPARLACLRVHRWKAR
jgi:hypothetical protein